MFLEQRSEKTRCRKERSSKSPTSAVGMFMRFAVFLIIIRLVVHEEFLCVLPARALLRASPRRCLGRPVRARLISLKEVPTHPSVRLPYRESGLPFRYRISSAVQRGLPLGLARR